MLPFLIALFAFASPLTYTRVESVELPNVSRAVASVSTASLTRATTANKQGPQQAAATVSVDVKETTPVTTILSIVATPTIPQVPFYSQFTDITSPTWQKVGCGVASLAMIIDYYTHAVPVNTLLKEGIASGAYLENAGWTYKGLIQLSTKYGLTGDSYDLGKLSTKSAFSQFEERLKDGPVIASVHYKFDPRSTIPHLVVIEAIDGDIVYYNDPAAKTGQKQISTTDFLKAWKKRFIVIRPVNSALSILPTSSSQTLSL